MGGTIQQTQKIVQLNAVAARIGTTAATPADNSLMVQGDGTFGDGTGNAKVNIDGDSAAAKGAYVSLKKDGSQTGAVGHRSSILGGTSSNLMMYTSTGDIDFYNGGTRMSINDSGQLTVGVDADPSQTASPSMLITAATAPSDVNGYSQLVLQRTDGVTGDGAQIMFNQAYHSGNTDYPAPVAAIRGYRTGSDTAYGGGLKLCYQPNSGALGVSTGLILDGAGKVAIGDLTPDTEGLEIVSPSADTSFNLNSQTDNLLVLRNSDNGSMNAGRFAGMQMKINSSGSAAEGTIRTEFTGNGDSSLIFSTTASGTGGDRLTIDKTGLAKFAGDTQIGDGFVTNYVKHVAGLDATVAISFTFPSQASRWIHHLIELRVAMGDDGATTATPTFLRYAIASNTSISGITQMDASLGSGITVGTSSSGTTFTITLTEGSAVAMDSVTAFATVTAGHGDAKPTGMTVA